MSTSPYQNRRARELRREQTVYEALLWKLIRNRQLEGFKFRRQMPISPYFADFACAAARLVVELDGNSHDERQYHDQNRDATFKEWGWTTLRVRNVDVRDRPNDVWLQIELCLRVPASTSAS